MTGCKDGEREALLGHIVFCSSQCKNGWKEREIEIWRKRERELKRGGEERSIAGSALHD